MSWQIALSRTAVEALRRLSRTDQELIAERIRHLEQGGLPPAFRGREEAVAVPAGDYVLVCMEEPTPDGGDGGRIVVVMLQPLGAEAVSPGLAARFAGWIATLGTGGGGMGGWMQDFGYAVRALRKAPGFATVATLTLALGIGATAAIYSVADGVLLEPLPYGDPDGVVTIHASWDNFPDRTWVAEDEFQLWHQENTTLDDAAMYYRTNATFTDVENPERVGAVAISPNFVEVLGVEPVAGRVFTWEESRLDEGAPVMIGYDTWERRYGRDPGVIGRMVEINGSRMPIVGVLPEGFVLPVDYGVASPSEVYYPYFIDLESPAPDLGTGGSHGAYVVGRLAEGQTVERARADLERVQSMVPPLGMYAPERQFTPKVFGAKEDVVGTAGRTIWLLLGTVAFVLLIACGNVANLLLARAEARVGEMAVRSALGASRWRMIRQLLFESAILAGLAGVLGTAVAAGGVQALLAVDPQSVPRSASVSLDGSVVLFTAGVSLLTALLFGAIPALRVARSGSAGPLREARRGGTGPGARRTQGLLVAFQMAMAVILLTSAGLMGRSFLQLLDVDPGFDPEQALTLRVTAPSASYPESSDIVGFHEEVLRRIRDIPGVRQAGGARQIPLASTMGDSGFQVEGYEQGPDESLQAEWQFATPGYLEVMGVPLLAGRTFDSRDGPDGPGAVIVNESLARRYITHRDPVGATMVVFGDTVQVVGVVGDVAHNGLTAERRYRWIRPHAQMASSPGSQRSLSLVIATAGPPLSVLEDVRREIRSLDPSIPVAEVRTMEQIMSSAVAGDRFAMVLLGAFATIALILSLVGIYGVISYTVSRRTREIGVRMALGAERGRVVGLVVRQGMVMALVGVGVGVAAALGLSGFMQGMLYGVEPNDTLTFVAVPALFALVALGACLLPAARAARVDPAGALRYD